MISETCSVCGTGFDVVFRYQMEERNGGFAFYCSQKCLETSQKGGDEHAVTCDGCSKRFTPDLALQVLYLGGKRKYACGLACRSQLVRESQGARLGDMVQTAKAASRPATSPSASDPEQVSPAQSADAMDVRAEGAAGGAGAAGGGMRDSRHTTVRDLRQGVTRAPGATGGPQGNTPNSAKVPVVATGPVSQKVGAAVSVPVVASGPVSQKVGAAVSVPVVATGPVSQKVGAAVSVPVAASGPVSSKGAGAGSGPVSGGERGAASGKSVPAPAGPVSSVPPPALQAGKGGSGRAPSGAAETPQSGTRKRGEEAPAVSSRTSGLMSAIRPEGEESAAQGDGAGTVIPVSPLLKGEKRAPDVKPVAPRRIAIFNHKGGTGKTTTAVSVAAGLAAKGKRVLLVDTDAQGNVSVSLGAGSERSLYHVLVMGLRVGDAVKEVRPNLHLLPSNETLAAAELYLAGRQNRDRVLADRLNTAAGDYDYVVLDCSPSLSLMNQNALVFADSVLVPVACDYLSLVGVRQVLKTVKNVNSLLHHPVQIWGVLPTFFDGRAKICNEAVATLKDHFGDKCLPPIRAAIKVKEAPSVGQTIFEYAAGSNAAEDYGVIVDRIIDGAKAENAGGGAREAAERAPAQAASA